MIKQFRLPDLGEGLTESEIVDWKVSVGDHVTLNQVIAEVETAKAVVELPSPYEGTIAQLHEQPGTVVAVGSPLVSIDVIGAGGGVTPRMAELGEGSPDVSADEAADEAPQPRRVPTLVGYGAEVERSGRPARRARKPVVLTPGIAPRATVAVSGGGAAGAVATVGAGAERPRSTPPVRKLARDLGVSLSAVSGTGPDGLITREDVLHALPTPTAGTAPWETGLSTTMSVPEASRAGTPGVVVGRESREPIRGVRKATAAAMVASAFTAPHVTEFLTVDVTESMALLERLRARPEFQDVKLTPLTLVAKALCLAVARTPSINSRWDESAGEIVTAHYVNLGIAAATPRGLLVPNVKDAQGMDLRALADALAQLALTARAGTSTPADLRGGTISITNIGVFGIDAGTPILNPGEAAILAMGAVRRTPWEYRGDIALRQVMTLSLSFDHRLVDGEQGSRFLADIGALLSDPGLALTML